MPDMLLPKTQLLLLLLQWPYGALKDKQGMRDRKQRQLVVMFERNLHHPERVMLLLRSKLAHRSISGQLQTLACTA
jgi:hypothetical protein